MVELNNVMEILGAKPFRAQPAVPCLRHKIKIIYKLISNNYLLVFKEINNKANISLELLSLSLRVILNNKNHPLY
ncbi:hypothetical protein MKX08_007695 [Trichoderma sp. CBMAI-0020]|nr:hypothetical protein MKX08_007695 [Trichoderma sp. CBMAI-0020]